jgi:SAM-dependent methyltransferase
LPYVLPRAISSADRLAFVLAFGALSVLEACSKVEGIRKVETPCERVCVVELDPRSQQSVTKLAGVHKFAPLLVHFGKDESVFDQLVGEIVKEIDVERFAVSAYEVPQGDHEALTRFLLDAFRAAGSKKIKLLRPKEGELLAEQVVSRDALDIIAFPYRGGYGLGPTAWVPDPAQMRDRDLAKPAPRPEISLSPRLAQLLLNLSGLSPGMRLLDPFCGSGTILTEGLFKSFTCIGVDSNQRSLRDAKRNLVWAKGSGARGAFALKLGDATDLQSVLSEKVDAVVTEPVLLPRIESRLGTAEATELVEASGGTYARALASMADVLRPGGRIVIVVPVVRTAEGREVSISLDGAPLGLGQFQPGHTSFQYPVRLSFESTRWIRRAVYVFESRR